MLVRPAILCGGSGTRLWPASRVEHPKPFLALAGDETLLVETLRRLAGRPGFLPPLLVGGLAHRALIERDLERSGIAGASVILEPVARDTAAAVTLAALACADDVLLVMPSDHVIADPQALAVMAQRQAGLAEAGSIVCFGVAPTRPETGYGYIVKGAALESGAAEIARFVEKPGRRRAEMLIAEGALWNSGMFMFHAGKLLDRMAALDPETLENCRAAMAAGATAAGRIVPAAGPLERQRQVSFDRAIMEKHPPAAVAQLDGGWSDAGSWDEVWRAALKNAQGNVLRGNVVAHKARNSLVSSAGPLTVVAGLDDVVVINTGETVLVTTLAAAPDLKQLVESLRPAPEAP